VVLAPTAAFVWSLLEQWMTPEDIDRRLAEAFNEVPAEERLAVRTEILAMFGDEDLVERG
jgi:hypothetical protein